MDTERNEWKDAIEQHLASLHLVCPTSPQEAIRTLLEWEQKIACDPAVSSEAAALVHRTEHALRLEYGAGFPHVFKNLLNEANELRQDAERYRWLRKQDLETGDVSVRICPKANGGFLVYLEALDGVIDRMMQREARAVRTSPQEGSATSETPRTHEAAIEAAHPMETGRHDIYAEAMRLVGERHEKYEELRQCTSKLVRYIESMGAGLKSHVARDLDQGPQR